MDFFLHSLSSALALIIQGDRELYFIVYVSLRVSFLSTLIASAMGVPLGVAVALREFPGKRGVITVLNTLLALPTVVVGLFVFIFLSRQGVFGHWGLLYTQEAIVIGQVILILPLVMVLTLAAVSRIDERYRRTALTLGASGFQTSLVILREARFGVLAAVIAAFGRVIAEIGIAMMVGGNIKGFTRTMTTAMALEHDKGEFLLAMALGVVLLGVSLVVNAALQLAQGRFGGRW